jgi:hypothetical protein
MTMLGMFDVTQRKQFLSETKCKPQDIEESRLNSIVTLAHTECGKTEHVNEGEVPQTRLNM